MASWPLGAQAPYSGAPPLQRMPRRNPRRRRRAPQGRLPPRPWQHPCQQQCLLPARWPRSLPRRQPCPQCWRSSRRSGPCLLRTGKSLPPSPTPSGRRSELCAHGRDHCRLCACEAQCSCRALATASTCAHCVHSILDFLSRAQRQSPAGEPKRADECFLGGFYAQNKVARTTSHGIPVALPPNTCGTRSPSGCRHLRASGVFCGSVCWWPCPLCANPECCCSRAGPRRKPGAAPP